VLFWLQHDGLLVIQTFKVVIVSNRNKKVHYLSLALTVNDEDRYLGLGRNKKLAGPRFAFIVAPHDHFIIVDDWVLYFILHDGIPNLFFISFIQKFG
jgi:hypothetical protein